MQLRRMMIPKKIEKKGKKNGKEKTKK